MTWEGLYHVTKMPWPFLLGVLGALVACACARIHRIGLTLMIAEHLWPQSYLEWVILTRIARRALLLRYYGLTGAFVGVVISTLALPPAIFDVIWTTSRVLLLRHVR